MNIDFFKKGISLGLGFFLCLAVLAGGTVLIADALHVFSANQVVSSSQINANFNKLPPIGSIQAWHKDLGGVPGLPDGWVQCDGQVLSDSESPLNGQTIPNLNSPVNAWNSKGSFLRGSTTSGIFENDAFQGHHHNSLRADGSGSSVNPGYNPPSQGALPYNSFPYAQTAVSDGVNGTPRTGAETRSVNMSVVWIMRVK